jgi:hypothetical protein
MDAIFRTSEVPRSRAGHRERMRRHRQRQRAGCLSITTDFTPEETAKLCRLRYLTEHELEDRHRIAEAVHELLANIVIDEP